jgi:hypothetical protein
VGRGQIKKILVGKPKIMLLKAEKKAASLNTLPFILE